MVNVDVLRKVQAIAAVHDEASKMAKTVAAEGVHREVVLVRRQKYSGCTFEAVAVEVDLLDALIDRAVLTVANTGIKVGDASLDEVEPAAPILVGFLNDHVVDRGYEGLGLWPSMINKMFG
ncbi:hypothetical protein HG530_002802 [Fusarium avenaceum]|nr:hypothetical protein HG530_002802 [Fusarium avenaceum]